MTSNLYTLQLYFIFFFSFFLLSCNKEASNDQNVIDKSAVLGSYSGSSDSGDSVPDVLIISGDTSDLIISSFLGVTFPGFKLTANILENKIVLDSYNCVNCLGLPTPSGMTRFYDAHLSGYANCYVGCDSIVFNIEYLQTGDIVDAFTGEIYLTKR